MDAPQALLTVINEFGGANLSRYFSERSPLPQVAVEGALHIVRHLNHAFCQLVGKAGSELIGRPFSEAVPEGVNNKCLTVLDRVYRTGMAEELVDQVHLRGVQTHWSYAMWGIFGPDERPVGVMMQVTDATEDAILRSKAVEMNESLLLSTIRQHELTEIAESLNTRLQAAIQQKDHFMAVLSHELRTPLSPVLAAISLLRSDKRLDGETLATLEMVDRNVMLEARLIDDLLDMTRIDRGRMTLERRVVDLGVVIDHAVGVCRPDLEAGGLRLEVDSEGGPFLVDADEGRLQQVFWNLLRNSIKFSPVGGLVRIRCRRRGDSSVVVEVSDRGIGIDPDLLPHVFNAFRQGDAGQVRKYGGLGLGLALGKTIVELHGGTIAAQSEGRGKGALFTVILPVLAGVRAIPTGEAQATPEPVGPLRILLVEDHPDGAWAMRQLLNADGHAVQWAPDIATGARLASEQPFDLLISDLGLPDGSGLDLMRRLRQQGSTLPGITLSGYGQEEDITQSGEAGFAAHLTKPASREVLQATIRLVANYHRGQ